MTNKLDATSRRLIHTRTIECCGYLRTDGLWDIEGRMGDVKTHSALLSDGSTLAAGQIFHGMTIRLTVDDAFIIREIDVSMSNVPTNECRGAMPAYGQLLGMYLGAGFARQLKVLFGGTQGCIHLTELLLPIATTAFQTIPMGRTMVAPRNAQDLGNYQKALTNLVNTCHALRESGPVAASLLRG